MRMKCRLFSVSLSVSMAMPPAPKCKGSSEVRMAPNVSVQGQGHEGHSGGHPPGVDVGAGLTCKECPVLEDVPVDLSGGLCPGDEGHTELFLPQQLHVGFGHRPPHSAELWVTDGRAGRGLGGTAHPAGVGRGTVPPALPAPLTMPSSGAALFCTGCSNSTLPSGSLKRTRLGRPSLRASRGGDEKGPRTCPSPPPAPPSLSIRHRGVSGRADGGHRGFGVGRRRMTFSWGAKC